MCPIIADAQMKVTRLASAQASFRQTKESLAFSQADVQYGDFKFVAPDSILWRYNSNNVVRMPSQMLALIKLTIEGDESALESVFLSSWQGKTLSLIPRNKQMKRFFSSILIRFANSGVAEQVVLTEPNGDTTKIDFLNMKYTLL